MIKRKVPTFLLSLLAFVAVLGVFTYGDSALATTIVEDSLTNEGQLIPEDQQAYFDSLPEVTTPDISTFARSGAGTRHLFVLGHGGGDSGATGSGTSESAFTRNELLPALQKYANQLKYTTIDFYDPTRNMYADSANSDEDAGAWTVSTDYASVTEFHLDGSTNTSRTGGHVIAYRGNSTATNLALAQVVGRFAGLNSAYTNGMSYRTDLYNMRILQSRGIPYRLIEIGFISNPNDVARIRSNLDAYAQTIVGTISGESGSSIESFNASIKTISANGWFTSSQDTGTGYPYIYFVDENGNELAKTAVNSVNRSDIATEFPNIATANASGFNFSMSTPTSLMGKTVYMMGRKSSTADGNNPLYNVYFTQAVNVPGPETKGSLDTFTQDGNTISASGWFFNTLDTESASRYLFLLDENGKELYRTQLNTVTRNDVASANPDFTTASTSGFNVTFDIPESLRGQTVQVMVRSASDASGNVANYQTILNSSQKIDGQSNVGSLDAMTVTSNSLTVNGWHYSEQASSTATHQLQLVDEFTGAVLQTITPTSVARTDVAAAYGQDALNSGFNGTFTLTSSDAGKVFSVRSVYRLGTTELANLSFTETATVPRSDGGQTIYRLYNPTSTEHLYSSSSKETLTLIQNNWNYEGTAWVAAASGNNVYRLFNPNNGEHFYTTSQSESNNLVSLGWNYEGVSFYSDTNQAQRIFRLFNPNATTFTHHYTYSQDEVDDLVEAGWTYEGVALYALSF